MTMCKRSCIYKSTAWTETAYERACNYAWLTDRTRTMVIAEMYGVAPGSPEHRRLMKPENCPLFKPIRHKANSRKVLKDAYGAKKERAVKPYVPPADEKLLLQLYAEGLSDYAIAKKAGTEESKVRWWRYKRKLLKHRTPTE